MFEMKIKSMFFDASKVKSAVDKATGSALKRAGQFISQRAKTSIRKRKNISEPGKPPSSHTGLMRKISFDYGPLSQSVVIGPMKLNQKIGNAPEALEHGGTSVIQEGLRGKRRTRRVTIHARPFMGPAVVPSLQDAVRKTRDPIQKGILAALLKALGS